MNNGLYYIQDVSRGFIGNSMVWWKDDDCGYICDIKRAKVWTKEEAEKQCENSSDLRMWSKDYIDKRIQYHIDMQTVDSKHIDSGAKMYNYKSGGWVR